MNHTKQTKVLILSSDNSPNRKMFESILGTKYELSFKSVLLEITSFIHAYEPDILIHDWCTINDSQGRLFHQKYAQSSSSRDIFRMIVAPKVTPSMMAFAADTHIDKVIDVTSATLNLEMQLEILMNSSGHKEILNLIQIVKMKSGAYSQDSIDKKIEKIFEEFPYDENVQIEMAHLNLRRDKIEKSKSQVEKVLKKNPVNLRAVNLLSRILMKEGKWQNANKLLKKSNEISPYNSERLLLLGDSCFGAGDLDDAISFYNDAISANPDVTDDAEQSIGKVMIAQGDLEEALNLIQKSASEEEAAGYFNNAAVLSIKEKGDYKHAIKLYDMALKTLKTDKLKPKIYYNLALSYKKFGDLKEAIKFLKRALKYNPKFTKAERYLNSINEMKVGESESLYEN